MALVCGGGLAMDETPSRVTLTDVRVETLREQVALSGSSIPSRRVMLSPQVEGLVTRVLVDAGSWVEPGDPVLELDARLADIEIESVEARVREAEARHEDAIRVRDELLELREGRHASKTSIESAIAQVEIAAAGLAREEADLARARELRERHALVAPFAGMVVAKQAETGQWVQRDDAVIELVSVDTLRIRAPLPQVYFPRVETGASATVLFDALPGRAFEGRVFARLARGSESSRSFPVLIDIPNPEHLLAPGMSARVLVELKDGESPTLMVPRDAVVAKADGTRRVWRVIENDGVLRAYPVVVETGRARDGRLEVKSGELRAGERLVLLGNENLRPGQAILPETATPAVAAD
jgi:RND family efflux transporter MFP subunit